MAEDTTPTDDSYQKRALYQILQDNYQPCQELNENTELLSTTEIMNRINESFPGLALTGDTTYQLLQSLGFHQIENDTLQFLWALEKRAG